MPRAPSEPGVYYFLSKKGEILYVGKAINLSRRIGSYRRLSQDPKTSVMLSQARRLRWTKVESDLDAVLTEAELIRAHRPKYNLRLRDDKSPLYIIMTDEPFPRVLTARKSQLPQIKGIRREFGPYSSADQAKKVLQLARQVFPYCNASPIQKKQKRACFFYHIGLCPGACVDAISQAEYAAILNKLRLFLMGKKEQMIRTLSQTMKQRAAHREFEEAAKLRDQIHSIKAVTQDRHATFWIRGLPLRRRNARIMLWKTLSPYLHTPSRNVPKNPFSRIEAYDISDLSGTSATASMVVFSDGQPDPREYRRFRIRCTQEPNDPAMLAEAITRRLRHREWDLPGLMVIDGGKPQLTAAKRSLVAVGLHHRIPAISIAKRLEELIVHFHSFHVIRLPKDSQALQLVMRLRDEAHRYAQSYHHLLRGKSLTE